MSKKQILLSVCAVLLIGFALTHRHLFVAPNCVHVEGLNTVRVEDADVGILPMECSATEINTYLTRYDFEYVGNENTFDKVYVR